MEERGVYESKSKIKDCAQDYNENVKRLLNIRYDMNAN